LKDKLVNYIKAGYPCIYVISQEIERVKKELKAAAAKTNTRLHYWTATTGMNDVVAKSTADCIDPIDALTAFAALPKKALVAYQDLHMVLKDDFNAGICDLIRANILNAKKNNKIMVIMGTQLVLPPEIEKEFSILELDLPTKPELTEVLGSLTKGEKFPKTKIPDEKLTKQLVDAASGLTSSEAENAFSLSLIEGKKFTPSIVSREKAETIKKTGILEILHPDETEESIGGLDLLKGWIKQRKNAFGPEAREYGLPSPRGILIIGVPGTGKSLIAKATASILQRPIVKLDVGKLFEGIVGSSEANTRIATATAEAIAPCVLFIDELEKGFSGTKSSNATDGGTSSRVFGHFISWMQDRVKPVFIIGTANDVTQLPVEFLRKGGRWDELFFCDIPDWTSRIEIWRIQLKKYKQDDKKLNVHDLAMATKNYTGAEIEQCVIDAMFEAFDKKRKPTEKDYINAIAKTVPLSRTMKKEVKAIRDWGTSRARPACSDSEEPTASVAEEPSNRTISVDEEKDNPF